MKRTLVAVVGAAFFLVASPVIGQQGRHKDFPIQGWIDAPYNRTTQGFEPVPYEPGTFHIDGWTFDCRDGQPLAFLAVLDHNMGTGDIRWISDYRVIRDQVRPDVQAAFIESCPLAAVNTGYSIYLDDALASGSHILTVFWTTGDGYTQSRIVPITVP
jgi:hypothetical protein